MAFPQINIKATNVDLNDRMRGVIEERLLMTEKLISPDTNVTCDAEIELTNNEDLGRQYRGEANLQVNGNLYRAEAHSSSVEGAFEEVRNQLRKELRRAKDKEESLIRRGGRKLKEMLRFGRGE